MAVQMDAKEKRSSVLFKGPLAILVGIFNTRSFPSLQAAYMVQTWQKVAVSENELLKKYLLVWA
jgi:hypothetical protein